MDNRLLTCMACLVAGLTVPAVGSAAFIPLSIGGTDDPASIQATVDAFRTALGDPNNGNAPGPLPNGRREINWDGGGATTASPAGTPFAGFQNTRGALFTTLGSGFLQTPLDAPELTDINPTYETAFNFFSPLRIFTPIGSNITDVLFFVPGPGTTTPATVDGFGAVFSDVDLGTSSSMTFFDVNDNVLFAANVPAGTVAEGSLSFLGATASAGEQIFRVRLVSGTTALGPTDNPTGGVDVAVFDDFLYREPQAVAAVPEPSVLMLLGAELLGLYAFVRGRRRSR